MTMIYPHASFSIWPDANSAPYQVQVTELDEGGYGVVLPDGKVATKFSIATGEHVQLRFDHVADAMVAGLDYAGWSMVGSHDECYGPDGKALPFGRCDECGAPCDEDGCTVSRFHIVATDMTDARRPDPPDRVVTVIAEVVTTLTDAELIALGKRYRKAEDGTDDLVVTVDDALDEIAQFGLIYGQGLGNPMDLPGEDFSLGDTEMHHGRIRDLLERT